MGDVSALECIGTPRFTLQIYGPIERKYFDLDMEAAMSGHFLRTPLDILLSEATYRMIMGRIESQDDFFRIRREIKEYVEGIHSKVSI